MERFLQRSQRYEAKVAIISAENLRAQAYNEQVMDLINREVDEKRDVALTALSGAIQLGTDLWQERVTVTALPDLQLHRSAN